MNQEMNKVETYPAFINVKVIGETDHSIDIPGTTFACVSYGKRFFVKYKNPYRASLNWTNIVGMQICYYDTVQLVKKQLPKGFFRKILHLPAKVNWVIEKTGEIKVERIILTTGEALFVEPLEHYFVKKG